MTNAARFGKSITRTQNQGSEALSPDAAAVAAHPPGPAWRRMQALLYTISLTVGLLILMGAAPILFFQRPDLATASVAGIWAMGALLMATRRSLRLATLAALLVAIAWALAHWLIMHNRSTFLSIDDPWRVAGYLLLGWQASRLPYRMRPRASLLLLAVFGLCCAGVVLVGMLMQHHVPWNTGIAILLCLAVLVRAAPAIEAALHGASPDGRLLWVCGLLAYTSGYVVLSLNEMAFPGMTRQAANVALLIGSLLVPCGLFAEASRLSLGFWSFVISISALLTTWALGVLLLANISNMLLLWCLFQGILFLFVVIAFSMWFSGRAPRVLGEAVERLAAVERQRETKADFLANLSHELRTPLNAILGFSDLLSTAPSVDEPIRRQAAAMRSTGQRLLALINDILDLSKLRAGKLHAAPSAMALSSCFDEVLGAVRPLAQSRGITVQWPGSALPQQMITDKTRFHQLARTVLETVLAQGRRGQTVHVAAAVAAGKLVWQCRLEGGSRLTRKSINKNPTLALRVLLAKALAELLGGCMVAEQPWHIQVSLPLKPEPSSPAAPGQPSLPETTLPIDINHKMRLIAVTLGFMVPILLLALVSVYALALVEGVSAVVLLVVARLLHRQPSWRLAAYGLGSIAAFQFIWLPVSMGLLSPMGVSWVWISRVDDILWLGGLVLLMVVLVRLPQRQAPWRGLVGWLVVGLGSLPMANLGATHNKPVFSYDYAYTVVDLLLLTVTLPQLEAALVGKASSGRLVWGFGLLMAWLGHTLDGHIHILSLQILWAMSTLAVAVGLLIEARQLAYGETALLSWVGALFVVISWGLRELSGQHVSLSSWLFMGTAVLALGALASLSRPQSKLAQALGQLDGIHRQRQLLEAEQAQFANHMTTAMNRHINSLLQRGRALLRITATDVSEEYVQPIMEATEHLQGLLADVIDFTLSSERDASMARLEPTVFSMPVVLQSVVTLVKQMALVKGIRLDTEVDRHLPALHADQRRFKQMLYNYLSNAIKFTPQQGQITISARPISRTTVLGFQASPGFDGCSLAQATVFVQVCVADSGPGIDRADQSRLFGHYEQIQRHGDDVAQAVSGLGGTGLGLMLVRNLAAVQGGAVAVDSAPGQGSRFYFFLPLRAIPDQAEAMAALPGGVP